MKKIICISCGKEKIVKAWNAKTCSSNCNLRVWRINNKEKNNLIKRNWRRKNGVLEKGSVELSIKISTSLKKVVKKGADHFNWKSDSVGYRALHLWIKRQLGKIKECGFCGNEGRIEWASISHKAIRNINDYIPLCVQCHRNYDRKGIIPLWQ
jgi:hypothetical protein